jgi:catechol 2,3-dioxygenase-like lactoylglutathione lyase family enzyme
MTMKLHISFKVDDLDQSARFYSRLFAQDPSVIRDDYIKWDVDNPPVNFVIEQANGDVAGFDHMGIQVETDNELQDLATRMRDSGRKFADLESAHCCYARSEKAWVEGMAREPWEAFLTHSHDSKEYGDDRNPLDDLTAS